MNAIATNQHTTVLASAKYHYAHLHDGHAACGKTVGFWLSYTNEVEKVTCQTCLKSLDSKIRRTMKAQRALKYATKSTGGKK